MKITSDIMNILKEHMLTDLSNGRLVTELAV